MPTSAGSAFRSQNRLLDFLLERQRAAKVLAPASRHPTANSCVVLHCYNVHWFQGLSRSPLMYMKVAVAAMWDVSAHLPCEFPGHRQKPCRSRFFCFCRPGLPGRRLDGNCAFQASCVQRMCRELILTQLRKL